MRELAYLYNHTQSGAGRVHEKHPFLPPHSAGKEAVLCVPSGTSPMHTQQPGLNEWRCPHSIQKLEITSINTLIE